MSNSTHTELLNKLNSRDAKIGIVGMGYVGLPLALRFSEVGYEVVGFDIDPRKVDGMNGGHSHIEHIDSDLVAAALDAGFHATSDMSEVRAVDAIILCLPTPLSRYREPDLSYVTDTVESLVPFLRSGQVVSLESTTYPGTTEEQILPRIESNGMKVGEELFLVYSPEREDPGNPDFGTSSIPKVCGGHTPACLEAGLALYGSAIDQLVPVSSTQVAEMTKLLENIHRAVNIGLVNEMKIVADRMGINIHEVIEAAKTKPFGFTPYYPGPGLGGHCIPIDPFYLTWKAREFDTNTRFIELAGEVNTAMPKWVIGKVNDALNVAGKSVNGSRILVLGIAYKKNVDDMRESPSAVLIQLLLKRGAIVQYSDPYVPEFPKMREHEYDMRSIELNNSTLDEFDLVLLATDHDAFDYELIRKHSNIIVDTRGRYAMDPSPHIVPA